MDDGMRQKLLSKMVRDEDTDCWLCTAATNNSGYCAISWRGKLYMAHRASWIAHNGPIPNGQWVLHKCDVKNCINPTHLFLGTAQDNMDDLHAKGRLNGNYNGLPSRALVTSGMVDQMVELRKQGYSYERIANRLMIGNGTVREHLLGLRNHINDR